jgi:hypothetical protein
MSSLKGIFLLTKNQNTVLLVSLAVLELQVTDGIPLWKPEMPFPKMSTLFQPNIMFSWQ